MLMLDEPTSAMDPRAEHLVIRRFKELAAGKAALFVTHNLENACCRPPPPVGQRRADLASGAVHSSPSSSSSSSGASGSRSCARARKGCPVIDLRKVC